jgi:hypothetical protein
MLPWDLEDWLTDEGDRIVHKEAATGYNSLDGHEKLIYEIWLLDTEQRNGGVSQYFCNHGMSQWAALCSLATSVLPPFAQFAEAVNQVVDQQSDPYDAIIGSDVDLDQLYDSHQIELVKELKAHVQQGPQD